MKRSSPIVPCIWFDDQAEVATDFYARTFPNGRVVTVTRYPESMDNPSHKPRGSVLTVDFELAGQRFTALNGGPQFVANPTVSFMVLVDTVAEVDRLFTALAKNGEPLMLVDRYPWSERYGWVKDRYGVSWQVMAAPAGGARIIPCLMFAGKHRGRAEEAMKHYTSIFPGGRIESIARYEEGEGPIGKVKHGRFVLNGQEMAAMDPHMESDLAFNEALSFQLMCERQAEVDRYWEQLSAGGEKGPCGWLKDRFGLSWQVVPADMPRWMSTATPAGRDRAFAAMLHMQKLDIATLQRAYEGA